MKNNNKIINLKFSTTASYTELFSFPDYFSMSCKVALKLQCVLCKVHKT